MAALRRSPPYRTKIAELLTWDFGGPMAHAWQLINGEPVAMAPASGDHGTFQWALTSLSRPHLTAPVSRRRAVIEPEIIPRGGSDRNYRIPDIGITGAPHSDSQILAFGRT
jgi:hypothetical protein